MCWCFRRFAITARHRVRGTRHWRSSRGSGLRRTGDIVHSEVGYKVPLTNENDIVAQMEKILFELANNRNRLDSYGAKELLMFGNALLGMQRRSLPLGFSNGQSSKVQNPTFRLQEIAIDVSWQILITVARPSGQKLINRTRSYQT